MAFEASVDLESVGIGKASWEFPCYNPNMAKLTLDSAGRVLIPKAVRHALRLEPGDTVEIETAGEEIRLRPVSRTGSVAKERGIWVLRTGQRLGAEVTDDVLQRIRAERSEANLSSE